MEPPRTSIPVCVVVTGFGTTVAMWAAAYVCRLPLVMAPAPLLGALLLLCLLVGGAVAGRDAGTWRAGLLTGLLSALLNFLVLGSLLTSPDRANEVVPTALLWIPGFLAASGVLGAVGGLVGASRMPPEEEPAWAGRFALIAAAATLLLVVAGGLVTGAEAGMDVPDWPNSFGYNMFLYPVSRMTGGIYYEHAHRLFGSLLGLATIVMGVYLLATDRRRGVKRAAIGLFLLVTAQGIMGGLRVTESSLALAVVHGVVGQVVFAAIIAVAAVTSRTWTGTTRKKETRGAHIDRRLGWALLALSTAQIALGALVRHFDVGLHPHITGAVLVFFLGLFAGFRAWGLHGDLPPLRKTGVALLVLIVLQLGLGFAALVAAGATAEQEVRPTVDVLITTAHQATGALIIAAAALLTAWSTRLLAPGPNEASSRQPGGVHSWVAGPLGRSGPLNHGFLVRSAIMEGSAEAPNIEDRNINDVLKSLIGHAVTVVNPESFEKMPVGYQIKPGFYRAKVSGMGNDYLVLLTEQKKPGKEEKGEPVKQYIALSCIKRVSLMKSDRMIHL
jgi:cytochrome c oxidase assembly protein subunit 15